MMTSAIRLEAISSEHYSKTKHFINFIANLTNLIIWFSVSLFACNVFAVSANI